MSIETAHAYIMSRVRAFAFFLVTTLSIFLSALFLFALSEPTTSPSMRTGGPALGTASTESRYDVPVRLRIPKIGIDAFVQPVGLTDDATTMDVPSNFTDVGWYTYGPRPGELGSSVMTGHLNGKGVPEAVFYHLGTLAVGDDVFVTDASSTTLHFRVNDVRTYAHDAETKDVFMSDNSVPQLNLITCAGTWMDDVRRYDERTVVFTELVGN